MRCLFLPLLLAACGLASCTAPRGPIGFWSRNRLDQQGERHGPWVSYYDTSNTVRANTGHFRHGREVGRWRYYTPGAGLERWERFHRNRLGVVSIAYFHPNGRLARRGRARYVQEADGAHFYWFGDWRVYDPTGTPIKVETYGTGRLLSSRKP